MTLKNSFTYIAEECVPQLLQNRVVVHALHHHARLEPSLHHHQGKSDLGERTSKCPDDTQGIEASEIITVGDICI